MSTTYEYDAPAPAVMASWWPAAVQLEDGTAFPRARAYVTADGTLLIYDRVPESERFPSWSSAVDFARTPRPSTADTWPRLPADIYTADGLVVVQPLGGCGSCSARMKSWRPSWAGRRVEWAAP